MLRLNLTSDIDTITEIKLKIESVNNDNNCAICGIKQGVYSCISCSPLTILCATCDNITHASSTKRNHNRQLYNPDKDKYLYQADYIKSHNNFSNNKFESKYNN